MTGLPAHPIASFWLDVVDKIIKLAAVIVGAAWTYWHYRKGRTYEQKLELEVSGTVSVSGDLYGDVLVIMKNIGATRHILQHQGTFCEIFVVRDDLVERPLRIFRCFALDKQIEPGESINDSHYWRLPKPIDDIRWVKVHLRVISGGVEWFSNCLIRVEHQGVSSMGEVTR
jgi:hypothetical protein